MRAVGIVRAFALISWVALAACGSGHTPTKAHVPTNTGDDDGGADQACVDEDGDGFGANCSSGDDCDDTDPTVTDQCRRCGASASKGCPCTPGTKALSCTPPVVHVTGGVLVCREGSRYCRDSLWSDCETIGQYVFQPDP